MVSVATPGLSAWRDFMLRTEHANVFQGPEMAEVYRSTKGYRPRTFWVEGENGIRALLSCVLIRYASRAGSRLATRSLIVGGPLGEASLFPVLVSAHDGFALRHALFTEVRNLRAPDSSDSFRGAGYEWEDHLNFIVDLSRGEPSVLGSMSRDRRRGIAKAQRNGVDVVRIGPEKVEQCYAVLRETYARTRIPLADISLFQSAVRLLTPRGHLQVWGAVHAETLCAVRFVLGWGATLFDWYAGSTEYGRNLRASELIVWEVFRYGIEHGFTRFDFGGAGSPKETYGPGEFKRTFGGERINPGRFVKVHHPLALRISKAAYNLWRMSR